MVERTSYKSDRSEAMERRTEGRLETLWLFGDPSDNLQNPVEHSVEEPKPGESGLDFARRMSERAHEAELPTATEQTER